MDATFFLRRRTRFIRRYFATAIAPVQELQRKIDAGDSPYEVEIVRIKN